MQRYCHWSLYLSFWSILSHTSRICNISDISYAHVALEFAQGITNKPRQCFCIHTSPSLWCFISFLQKFLSPRKAQLLKTVWFWHTSTQIHSIIALTVLIPRRSVNETWNGSQRKSIRGTMKTGEESVANVRNISFLRRLHSVGGTLCAPRQWWVIN